MRSFVTEMPPPRVVFGAGTLSRTGAELDRLNVTRAVVLSTGGQAALARRVANLLGSRVVGHFAGAVPHTPVEVTEQALDVVRLRDGDGLVSVGGGATTGLGKAVASRLGISHLVLPTTYAGSELTPVLGETSGGEKVTRSGPEILPDAVVYDVELTLTLPWPVTLTSAVNAMAHSVEALYGPGAKEETNDLAMASIRSLLSGLRDLRGDRGTFGLPHAPTHAVVLPYAMAYNAPAVSPVMGRISEALGDDSAPGAVQALVRNLGGPTALREFGFSEGDADRAAELTVARPYPNPRPVTKAGVLRLLYDAQRGDPVGLG